MSKNYAWDTYEERIDPETQYRMRIIRTRMGIYCGYVNVPTHHPWYMVDNTWTAEDVRKSLDPPTPLDNPILAAAQESFDRMHEWRREKFLAELQEGVKFLDVDSNPIQYLEVHGGVTYSGKHDEPDTKDWWLGFDCGHYQDYNPSMEDTRAECYRKAVEENDEEGMRVWSPDSIINQNLHEWTADEVWEECRKLAKQIKEAESGKDSRGTGCDGAGSDGEGEEARGAGKAGSK